MIINAILFFIIDRGKQLPPLPEIVHRLPYPEADPKEIWNENIYRRVRTRGGLYLFERRDKKSPSIIEQYKRRKYEQALAYDQQHGIDDPDREKILEETDFYIYK